MKKFLSASIILIILMFSFSFAVETTITLSNDKVLVGEEEISTDLKSDVYLQKAIETHPDVSDENKNLENKIITITKGGEYKITGKIEDAQIRVETVEDITLVLDNAEITCKTAPAILINSAADDKIAGEARAKIVLENKNIITGSHVAKYYDEAGNKVKNDAAISSKVSLLIEGTGSLRVNADNEGIESKMHLTINSGTIEVFSGDDALNASEDGVSHIIINGGSLYAIVQNENGEGDGIDSNGYITINGGFVSAQAHPTSQDSGLDADLGILINGGTVIATGNMYEGIEESSSQQFMQLYFSNTQKNTDLIVITDENDTPIIAFKPINSFTILECSSPLFKDGTYYVYSGGDIEGDEKDGVYTNITSYKNGTKLSHTGVMQNMGRPNGDMPDMGNMSFDKMEKENMFNVETLDFSGITLPEGVSEETIKEIINQLIQSNFAKDIPNREDGMQMPQGGENFEMQPNEMQNGKQNESNENRSYEFVLSETEHVYRGVSDAKADEVKEIKNEKNNSMEYNIDVSMVIVIILIVAIVILVVLLIKKK